MYQWDFGILWSYRWLFLNGLGVTVGFTVVIVVLGLVFGLFGAFGSLSRFKAVRLTRPHLHRGVPLHADPGAADLVLLRAADPGRRRDDADHGLGAGALALWRLVLFGDHPRRHHLDRQGPVGSRRARSA